MRSGSQTMKKIIAELSSQKPSKNQEFTDVYLPPKESSLYSKNAEQKQKNQELPQFLKGVNGKIASQFHSGQKEGKYGFMPLDEIYDVNSFSLLSDGTNLEADVIQGELGDCYFLSALAALAENAENLRGFFDKNAKASDRSFTANVVIHGEPVAVTVDNFFPTTKGGKKVAFAGINKNSGNIWPIILEKAWAKCNRSYEDIIKGTSAEALQFLTPAPVETYYHQYGYTELFDIIQKAKVENYIVLTDITNTEGTNLANLSEMGLITNHAYSVIDTVVLTKPNGEEFHLVKLKNLWGTNEWHGDWSDDSPKWTKDFKQQVGLEQGDDGIFWMAIEDYLQFYTTTYVCKVNAGFNYVCSRFVSGENESPYTIAKVIVNKGGAGFFVVNMKNSRIYRNLKDKPTYQNPYCSMTVFRQEPDGLTFIGSDTGKDDRLSVDCPELAPGTYFVAVTFPNNTKNFCMRPDVDCVGGVRFRVGVYSNVQG